MGAAEPLPGSEQNLLPLPQGRPPVTAPSALRDNGPGELRITQSGNFTPVVISTSSSGRRGKRQTKETVTLLTGYVIAVETTLAGAEVETRLQ